jgi:hypothetical protein
MGFDNSWYNCANRPYDDFSAGDEVLAKDHQPEVHQREETRHGSVRIYPTDKPPTPIKKTIAKDEYTIYKGVFVKGTEHIINGAKQRT